MKKLFTGVCTALVTPFRNGKIDFTAFRKLIEHQIEEGIDALVLLGTTGEASTLTPDEKKEVVSFGMKTVDGRVPLIFGLGGNNPASVIGLGKHVAECKEKFGETSKIGVLVTAPYYNKTTQEGLMQWFKAIARGVGLPLIVYNVPGRVGMNIEPTTLSEICRIKHIAGIKEASGNINQIAEVIRLCPKTAVYSGDDLTSLPSYALGAVGIISVASNIHVKETCEIWKRMQARKIKAARELFMAELPFYKDLFVQVNPIPVKHYMSKTGLCRNEVRLPLVPMRDALRR